jgi:hypothetical protein
MRTAEEILDKHYNQNLGFLSIRYEQAVAAINEARREALREAAYKAKAEIDYHRGRVAGAFVNKQSILDLIKELK